MMYVATILSNFHAVFDSQNQTYQNLLSLDKEDCKNTVMDTVLLLGNRLYNPLAKKKHIEDNIFFKCFKHCFNIIHNI